MKLWPSHRDRKDRDRKEREQCLRADCLEAHRRYVEANDERLRLRGEARDLMEENAVLLQAVADLMRATEVLGVRLPPEPVAAPDRPCPARCGHPLNGMHTAFGCLVERCNCLYAPIIGAFKTPSGRPSTVTRADEITVEAA